MNTKLLKKIRKRYVIEEVTFVDPSDNTMIGNFYEESKKLPFYIVSDKKKWYRELLFTNKNHCIECIMEWVRVDYERNKSRTRISKVWYNN